MMSDNEYKYLHKKSLENQYLQLIVELYALDINKKCQNKFPFTKIKSIPNKIPPRKAN